MPAGVGAVAEPVAVVGAVEDGMAAIVPGAFIVAVVPDVGIVPAVASVAGIVARVALIVAGGGVTANALKLLLLEL